MKAAYTIIVLMALAACAAPPANPSSNPNYCLTHPSACH